MESNHNLSESAHAVCDAPRVVVDDELGRREARLLVQTVPCVSEVAFLQKRQVRALWGKNQADTQLLGHTPHQNSFVPSHVKQRDVLFLNQERTRNSTSHKTRPTDADTIIDKDITSLGL